VEGEEEEEEEVIARALIAGLAGLLLYASAASASYHLMKIREINRGTDTPFSREDAFVELQMYAAGQNLVAGKELRFFNPAGAQTATFVFPANVPNGENQRTILVGDNLVPGGVDFIDNSMDTFGHFNPSGGAVCFVDPPATPIDCVAWGGFAGTLPAGAPASPAGLADGQGLERSITPSCVTLLEAVDDTDDSATDFSLTTTASYTPRTNSVAPTEVGCPAPDTKIDKGPKKKTKKKRAVFEFSSTTPGVTFECEVDGGKAFTPCTSPFEVRVKKGRHTFQVRAVLNGVPDGSPAEQSWRFKKKRK
jgi:hypothetical protein